MIISRARELQVTVGHPSDKDFIRILKKSSLPNCPVTPRDVVIANKLFGPDVGALKGKTTCRNPPRLTCVRRHHSHPEVLWGGDLMRGSNVRK